MDFAPFNRVEDPLPNSTPGLMVRIGECDGQFFGQTLKIPATNYSMFCIEAGLSMSTNDGRSSPHRFVDCRHNDFAHLIAENLFLHREVFPVLR